MRALFVLAFVLISSVSSFAEVDYSRFRGTYKLNTMDEKCNRFGNTSAYLVVHAEPSNDTINVHASNEVDPSSPSSDGAAFFSFNFIDQGKQGSCRDPLKNPGDEITEKTFGDGNVVRTERSIYSGGGFLFCGDRIGVEIFEMEVTDNELIYSVDAPYIGGGTYECRFPRAR